jgi:hypothetical protein
MTITSEQLTTVQAQAAQRIDGLDLEPIACKLMHPEPGPAVMTLAGADQLIAVYRCFLKLCAWYPAESIVPSKAIDEVWHAHILDTAKYDQDSRAVFGFFLHHFPYFGLRGADDQTTWQAAYARTRDLYRQHFGTGLSSGQAAPSCSTSCQAGTGGGTQCSSSGCHGRGVMDAEQSAADCENGALCIPDGVKCDKSDTGTMSQARPRPDRSTAPA